MLNRFPSKLSSLQFLRDCDISVGTVIDVGVNQQTYELVKVFPDKKHLLFEPVKEFNESILKNYQGLDYELFNIALSDTTSSAFLEVLCLTELDKITHSQVKAESTSKDARNIETSTLDDFLKGRVYEKPYLLKIDVDYGYELSVLEGAQETLKDVACLIIEAPIAYLPERLSYLLNQNFHLWDIVDLCYFCNTLNQVDLVLLSSYLWRDSRFYPWNVKPNASNYIQLDTPQQIPAQLQEEIASLKAQINQFQAELWEAREEVKSLNSSKFFKARALWFSIKQRLGFVHNTGKT